MGCRQGLPLGLLVLLALSGCSHQPVRADEQWPQAYRALALPSVGPRPLRLSDLRGQVVLVSFFATWCFPCVAELPVLEKLQRTHAAQGFTVVMVGMDLEGERVLRPFAEHYALPYPVLVADDRLRSGETPFGQVRALPTNVLFDRQGRVVVAYQGVASPQRLLELVEKTVRE